MVTDGFDELGDDDATDMQGPSQQEVAIILGAWRFTK